MSNYDDDEVFSVRGEEEDNEVLDMDQLLDFEVIPKLLKGKDIDEQRKFWKGRVYKLKKCWEKRRSKSGGGEGDVVEPVDNLNRNINSAVTQRINLEVGVEPEVDVAPAPAVQLNGHHVENGEDGDDDPPEDANFMVENPSLDLESYAGSYTGMAKLFRLIHIADHCPSLRVDALKVAITHVKQTYNVEMYQHLHQKLRGTSSATGNNNFLFGAAVVNGGGAPQPPVIVPGAANEAGGEAVANVIEVDVVAGGAAEAIAVAAALPSSANYPPVDTPWVEATAKKSVIMLDKLDAELKNHKSNSIKESIRRGYDELGEYYLECGDLMNALKSFTRSRDYCTSAKHVINMCLNIIKVSIYLQNWAHVSNYVMKAETTPDPSDDKKVNAKETGHVAAKLRCAMGLADLALKKYKTAARCFLQIVFDHFDFPELVSQSNVAVYAALCALASFNRKEMKEEIICSTSFKLFLEVEPPIRDVIYSFYESKYGKCLQLLDEMKDNLMLDMYIAPHVRTIYSQIRSRILIPNLDREGSSGWGSKQPLVVPVPRARNKQAVEPVLDLETSSLLSHERTLHSQPLQKYTQLLSSSSQVLAALTQENQQLKKLVHNEEEPESFPTPNFHVVKKKNVTYLGMLEYKQEDLDRILWALITDLPPSLAISTPIKSLPAYLLFMMIRYTDSLNDDERVQALFTKAMNAVHRVVRKRAGEELLILWLANLTRLLHTLKQYGGDAGFQADNTTKQNEQCLKNFDLVEHQQVLSDYSVWVYTLLIKNLEDCLQSLIVPVLLEYSCDPTSTPNPTATTKLDTLLSKLDRIHCLLSIYGLDPSLIGQIFKQLFYYVTAGALNNLLLRRDLCHRSKGVDIRFNISGVEEWTRTKHLDPATTSVFAPLIQASQVLQARKTDKDAGTLVEICADLSVNQVIELLNLYSSKDGLDSDKVSPQLITLVQEKLTAVRKDAGGSLLMDTKFSFNVNFDYCPSGVSLEEIVVPDGFGIGGWVKML